MAQQKSRSRNRKVPAKRPLTPGRAADRPFCAYMGEAGETCKETINLETILTIQGPPRMVLAACPRHRAEVHQLARAFVSRNRLMPQTLVFQYHGSTYRVRAKGAAQKVVR
ncbi:MAG TPA: hypothetical protein VGF67_29110 [Ktedonobacteraceae bacterium]